MNLWGILGYTLSILKIASVSLWGVLGHESISSLVYTLSNLKIAPFLTTLLLEKGAAVILRLSMMEREENRWLQKKSTNNLHSTGSKN